MLASASLGSGLDRQLRLTQNNHKFQLTLAFTAAVISRQNLQTEEFQCEFNIWINPASSRTRRIQISTIFTDRTSLSPDESAPPVPSTWSATNEPQVHRGLDIDDAKLASSTFNSTSWDSSPEINELVAACSVSTLKISMFFLKSSSFLVAALRLSFSQLNFFPGQRDFDQH